MPPSIGQAIWELEGLTSAHLTGADLQASVDGLREATLTGTDLDGAILTRAGLGGANLATAKNLTQQQLDSAGGDHRTKLSAGRQRPVDWSAGPAAPPAVDE